MAETPTLEARGRTVDDIDAAFVYFLADPRTPRHPRYVGYSVDPMSREKDHRAQWCGNEGMREWKLELRAVGLVPQIVVVGRYDSRKAGLDAEWRLIRRWQRRG